MTQINAILKEAAIKTVCMIDLYGDEIKRGPYLYDNIAVDFMECIKKNGVLTHDELCRVVHHRLIELGRSLHEVSTRDWADHIMSPHALAYAIQHDAFTQNELDQIKFDHDDTADTFMAGKIDNLVERVIKQMFEKAKPEPKHYDDGGICCADGGPCVA